MLAFVCFYASPCFFQIFQPLSAGPKDVLNDYFLCYQDFNLIYRYKETFLSESAFYKKKILCPLSLKCHLGNPFSPSGCSAKTVTAPGYFWQIVHLSAIHVSPGI